MGASKTESFSEEQNELANLFKAISHPARIAIIQYLLSIESCICGDIVDALPLAQPTVSQHLRELKNVGLIKGSVEGTSICYCLNQEMITKLEMYFGSLSKSLQIKCC